MSTNQPEPRTISTVEQLRDLLGKEVGVSGWREISQDLIDRFADLTGDRQWIHTDPERARAESPFGATIAHGFLPLSLLFGMTKEVFALDLGAKLRVNYGMNRVRFMGPVLVGMRIRGRFELAGVREFDGGVEMTWTVTVEAENETKPRMVAEWLLRTYY